MEYQFSDMSLLANDSFQKQMNKDPEGYGKDFVLLFIDQNFGSNIGIISLRDFGFATVPITLIASTKKIKSLVSNIHLLTQALRCSSKLVSILDGIRHSFGLLHFGL